MSNTLQLVIPMSGKGSRFEKAGYAFPKPLISVNGEPMITLVTRNLLCKCEQDLKVIYICQEEHYNQFDLENVLRRTVESHPESKAEAKIIRIKGITQGAACTVLMAKDVIDPNLPLMIANSDQYIFKPVMCTWHDVINMSENDGEIMVFNSNHPKWSYVRLEEDRVIEVAEKKVISEFATTGIYWWRKAGDFIESAEEMIKKDIRYNNEFYIAPTYNEMILKGKKISIMEIKPNLMQGLGTPEDLNAYLNEHKENESIRD